MAETKIEWTATPMPDGSLRPGYTLNFFIGCQEVSAGCDFCYARVQNSYRNWVQGWGPDGERKRTSWANWNKALRWNREAKAAGIRAKVFSNSLSDFFDNKADPEWRSQAWDHIARCDHLDFLLLTKRPSNIRKMLPANWGDGWANVWLGTTTEDTAAAQERLPHLLNVPAFRYFISYEPALGPLNLREIQIGQGAEGKANVLDGWWGGARKGSKTKVDWVIAGSESGAHRRPCDPDWIRSIRDQCVRTGVSFFYKQDFDGEKKVSRPYLDGVRWEQFPDAALQNP